MGWFNRSNASGETGDSAGWDDELAPPDAVPATRRIAFITVVVVLLALIVATLLFVDGDSAATSKVTAAATSPSVPGATFTTSLPIAVTVTSFSNPTSSQPASGDASAASSSTTAASSSDQVTTLPAGGTVTVSTAPGSSTTTTAGNTTTSTTTPKTTTSTSTTTTTTTKPAQFQYAQHPKQATGELTVQQVDPGCVAPTGPETFVLDTPQPGVFRIMRQSTQSVADGSVDPNGNFTASNAAGDSYSGTTSESGAQGTFVTATPCNITYRVVWTFS